MRILTTTAIVVLLSTGWSFGATPTTREQELSASCVSLAGKWKPKLDSEHFKVLISPPWVIAGDGGALKLAAYRDQTILAAERALTAMFFDKIDQNPRQPVLILLFESDESYRRLAKQWFGDTDVSHLGYFRHDNVMLMNVSTGTGTLVHELVHALMRSDFPQCPSWFNEGLASLFEQCSINGDQISGLVNWRLPALQDAIRTKQLRSIEELIEDEHFYDKKLVGLNYAQARYWLMYLQERGMLQKYYKSLRDHAETDRNGLKFLHDTVGPMKLSDLERDWQTWVLTLHFP